MPAAAAEGLREAFEAHPRRMEKRESQFGHLAPIIHTDFAGRKVVAVGQTVYHSDKWRTFSDFLVYFIKRKISETWYKAEYARDPADRHPLVQWYVSFCAFQARNSKERNAEGLFSGDPDGPSLAFLVLAHELFILEGELQVQKRLIDRLLHRDQFQGARYEVTVAATMMRAGFSLVMEDESDPSRPHPEFVATHRTTGLRVAVEAKSRHRGGVLGRPGDLAIRGNLAQDVRGLFGKALAKATDLPLFVFIEANLPADLALSMARSWSAEFQSMVPSVAKPYSEHGVVIGHPHNLLMITNLPFHFGAEGGPVPEPLFYSHWPLPEHCRHPVPLALIKAVETSLSLHGRIPRDFND